MKKQPKFNKKLWLAAMAVILALAVWMILTNAGAGNQDAASTDAAAASTEEAVQLPTQPPFAPIDLGSGIRITDIGSYTGAYVEDGTNEVVSDVMMLILENASGKALQYGNVSLMFGETMVYFPVTNLPDGARVVLLAQDRVEFISREPDGWLLENPVFLDEFAMYEDMFQISGEKGALTVRNISEVPVSGDIYVYYKNSSQDLYYGGITFRVRIDGLEPQEQKKVVASHYNPTASTILMVTFSQ